VVKEAREENQFRKPLDLWGVEGDDACRPVREALTSLSLAHRMIYCAEGSNNRQLLEKKTGRAFDVPFLEDPNTGTSLFNSGDIVKYLYAVYTVQKGETAVSIFKQK
jgi:glutathione S-transferase